MLLKRKETFAHKVFYEQIVTFCKILTFGNFTKTCKTITKAKF